MRFVRCCGHSRSTIKVLPKQRPKRKARFRPCIDIHQGKVKQIVGSTLSDIRKNERGALITNFVSDKSPEWYANLYKKEGLTGGHVIMLGKDQSNEYACIEAVKAWPDGLQVGGGINPTNAKIFLDAGASHIIVTSYVFQDGQLDPNRLQELVDEVGTDKIVLDLSCRYRDGNYWVVTDRWQHFSDLMISPSTMEYLSSFCAEFLVHGVDVEGKRCGVDKKLIQLLASCSPLPVTYAGGVKDLVSIILQQEKLMSFQSDLQVVAVEGDGFIDVTVGSALDIFGGSLYFSDVVAWHNR